MAVFDLELPNELIKEFEELSGNADKIMGEMTKAGARAVLMNVESKAPAKLNGHFKISKVYMTPTDGGINTKVYCSGYIPFSSPNRAYFSRYAKGKLYNTKEGVPASFLAIMYEYGRSNAPFPKHPFFRSAFSKNLIEQAMLQAQQSASHGLLV